MSNWQAQFARKIDTLKDAALSGFNAMADQALTPVFEEFQAFTDKQGMKSSAPLSQPGVLTFKFQVSENAYVLMAFRQSGIEQCEALAEFAVPQRNKVPQLQRRVDLADADAGWIRRFFEETLDRFVDVLAGSLVRRGEPAGEPVHA